MTVDDEASSESQPNDSAAGRRQPTRRYEAKRSAIVRSAVEEMNRKGVRGMTLGDVAARLDLVPTAVIYYFRNKEALYRAVLLDAYTEQEQIVAARLELAQRQRALRETDAKDAKASSEEERAIRLEQALLDDRQRALNDQRMLEGIRQQTIDAMRRHYLSHCPRGKARN